MSLFPRFFALVLFSLVLGCSSTTWPSAQLQADRAAVIAVANDLFAAMRARDADALRALQTPEVAMIRITENAQPAIHVGSPDAFIDAIVNAPAEPRERMWDPEVRIDGDLATLWAHYEFYMGDRFSHCGVDAFQLVRVDGVWKIVSIAFTRRHEGCDDAPPP
ncbi:MAG: nuclear transport factor 2 family protein [Phycisphaerales bacterium]